MYLSPRESAVYSSNQGYMMRSFTPESFTESYSPENSQIRLSNNRFRHIREDPVPLNATQYHSDLGRGKHGSLVPIAQITPLLVFSK